MCDLSNILVDYIFQKISDIPNIKSIIEYDKGYEKFLIYLSSIDESNYCNPFSISFDLARINLGHIDDVTIEIISRLDITDVVLVGIYEYIKELEYLMINNKKLQYLSIDYYDYTDDDQDDDDNMVKVIKTLAISNVKRFRFVLDYFTDKCIETLCEELPKTKLNGLIIDGHRFDWDDILIIAESVAKSNLSSFHIIDIDYLDVDNDIIDILSNNITLQSLPMSNKGFKQLETRNRNIQALITKSVITFICIRKFKRGLLQFPNEIVVLIAKHIFSTRSDLVWLRNDKEYTE